MDEPITNRAYAEQQVENGKWILFEPDDESFLSDEEFVIYKSYRENVKDGFS